MRDEPKNALALAEEAGSQLPDGPRWSPVSWNRPWRRPRTTWPALRQADVEKLATLDREKLGKPDDAREALAAMARRPTPEVTQPDRRRGSRLVSRPVRVDAGGPGRPPPSCPSAWKIDPQSRDVADAFRCRGFRRVNDDWVEPSRTVAGADVARASGPQPAPAATRSDSLRGSSPQEVRGRLGGQPNRKVFSATQGQLLEQWIYFGAKENQYINFSH